MKLLYQFAVGNSFLHKLDPRSKLFFILSYLVLTFIVPYPWIMGLAIIAILWVLGKTSPSRYYPFLLFLLPLMTAITIVHLFIGGAPYYEVGVIKVSVPGLTKGLWVAFRLGTMGITFIAFSLTTDPFDWGISMYQSGLNYKIAFMFAFAMRFLPLFQEELIVIKNALRARGYDTGSLIRPISLIKGASKSVIPLGLGALRRSQYIAQSMEMRGFSIPEQTGIKRTVFRDIRLRRADYLTMTVAVIALAGGIVFKILK